MPCSSSELVIANSSRGLTSGEIVNNELSSEIAFKELSISINTSTDKLSVDAFTLPRTK